MHVLFLPKWYPGLKDPQLGDFLRKQALATAVLVRLSVVHIESVANSNVPAESLRTGEGAWELVVRYRASTSSFGMWRKAVNFFRYMGAGHRAWSRVVKERGRPDLVHAYILVRPALLAWKWSLQFGVPYLVSEQSSAFLDGTYSAKGAMHRWLCRFLTHRARVVTAVSAWLGNAMRYQRLCDRYEVVPNVIPGLDRPLPPAGRIGEFLMVADLVDRIKNVSGVLRALHAARPDDARLRLSLIGDGPDRSALQGLVHELGLADHVTFLGRLPNSEVLRHMADAFAVIVNSNVETFSVVTGEALAQGKPVIATRCGGPQAFIRDSNGILIDPQDNEALARAMIRLCAEAHRFSPREIRGTVSDRFSPQAVGGAFIRVYEQALRHE